MKQIDSGPLICFIRIAHNPQVANNYTGQVHNKKRQSKTGNSKMHNPMEGIRETLEKNHITSNYVQRHLNKQNDSSRTIRHYSEEEEIPCKVFISDSDDCSEGHTVDSVRQSEEHQHILTTNNKGNKLTLFNQLLELGYLSILPASNRLSCSDFSTYSYDGMDSELIEDFDSSQMYKLVQFAKQVLKTRLVHAATLLNVIHNRCLQMFILTAFDMARDMQVSRNLF